MRLRLFSFLIGKEAAILLPHSSLPENGTKQVSDSLGLGLLLAISGGLMDAYSYLFRGQVFANAQTGNILLCGVNLTQGNWGEALQYALPVLMFSIGIALAAAIRRMSSEKATMHWRQVCVLVEAVVLFGIAWIPQEANLIANSLISLACGTQVESFRKIEGSAVATTMCIGNLRSAVHGMVEYRFTGKEAERKTYTVSLSLILAFTLGAVLGSILIRVWGTYAIWASSSLLAAGFLWMSIAPQEDTQTE